jgi:hypothetical protein
MQPNPNKKEKELTSVKNSKESCRKRVLSRKCGEKEREDFFSFASFCVFLSLRPQASQVGVHKSCEQFVCLSSASHVHVCLL